MTEINKNILLLTSEFPPLPGGIGNHAYNLAHHLNLKGKHISVIADNRSITDEEKQFDSQLNFKVHRISIKHSRIFMYFERLVLLFKLIKTSKTVIASGKFPLWIVAFSSFFYKRNYIAIIHGSEVNFSNSLLKKTTEISLKRFTKIIAVSNYTKALVSHLNLKNIKVIPNGFDESKWNHSQNRDCYIIGNPKLITVGNVTERKGQLNVIRHLPELIKIYPNIHYHCVGLATKKEFFFNEAKLLNVEKHISFHGRIKHEDLIDFYRESDVFVMLSNATSSGDVEGFGIAILEANHFGLPAIGSKNCGIEDAIENYKSGILVDHDNTKDFIETLNELLNKKEIYEVESRKWSSRHTWKIIIQNYIKEISL